MKRSIVTGLLFITLFILFTTRANATVIALDEDFEGVFPPPGWSIVNNVAGGSWQNNVARGVPNYCSAGGGDCAVAHPGDTNTVFWDTELRSPPIDLSNAAWASLSYASMFQDYAGNGELWLDISTDGGVSWLSVRNQTNDDPPGGTPTLGGSFETENLSAYVGHTVIFRWRFQASNTAAWCWHIDNVEVTAVMHKIPSINDISPNRGPVDGNTVVTIRGANFYSGAVVTFGGYQATHVQVVSDTSITCRTPPHFEATVDVMVRNIDLESDTLAAGFTYGNPGSQNILPDTDRDGVPDRVEQGCNGDHFDHDGNGDHIPDYRQAWVATFTLHEADGNADCLTVAVPADHRVRGPLGESIQNTPPWQYFPFGLFSIHQIQLSGETTTMTLFTGDAALKSYWLYGKTPDNPFDHWYQFLYDGETGAEFMNGKVLLHFADGKRGDNDLSADGVISRLYGGPARGVPHAELYYPYLGTNRGERTEMGLINRSPYPATVSLACHDADGRALAAPTTTVKAMGKQIIPFEALPPGTAAAIAIADADLVGYARSTGPGGQRCAWPAAGTPAAVLAVPHVAKNEAWRTMVAAFNPSDKTAIVTAVHASGAFVEYYVRPFCQLLLWPDEKDPLTFLESKTGVTAMESIDSLAPQGDFAALMLTGKASGNLVAPMIFEGDGRFTGIGLQNRHCGGVVGLFGYTSDGAANMAFAGEWPPYRRNAFDLETALGPDNLWARIVGRSAVRTPFGRLPMYMDGLAIYAQAYPASLAGVNLNALGFTDGCLGIFPATGATAIVALANAGLTNAAVAVTGFDADGAVTATGTVHVAAATNHISTMRDLLGDAGVEKTTHVRLASDTVLTGLQIISADGRMEILPVLTNN